MSATQWIPAEVLELHMKERIWLDEMQEAVEQGRLPATSKRIQEVSERLRMRNVGFRRSLERGDGVDWPGETMEAFRADVLKARAEAREQRAERRAAAR